MEETNKKQKGQFFTENSDYILQGLEKYVKDKEVVDPFAGGGDLIKWADKKGSQSVKGFEIDKGLVDKKKVFYKDSILDQGKYKFVLTNPPYLNVNKADEKTKEKYFSNFEFEDLYQISLKSIMNSKEGIVIVPLNFLSAKNSKEIRNLFFSKFRIVEMNYFKEQVFQDTTNNVIAFYYTKKENLLDPKMTIKTHIYPEGKRENIILEKIYDWAIGGKLLNKIESQDNNLGVFRLRKDQVKFDPKGKEIKAAFNHIDNKGKIKIQKSFYEKVIKNNIILLKAIDTGSSDGRISLSNIKDYGVECLLSKPSSRHMVHLIFNQEIPIQDQKLLIDLFNNKLSQYRKKYLSLFLTNYRDKNRKRITFYFTYKLINYIYYQNIKKESKKELELTYG